MPNKLKSSKTLRLSPRFVAALWFLYPFIALVVLAGILYYGAVHFTRVEPTPSSASVNRSMDLQGPEAHQELLALHAAAMGGERAFRQFDDAPGTGGTLNLNRIVYVGMIDTGAQRYLFECSVTPLQRAEVYFISEDRRFEFAIEDRIQPSTPIERIEADTELADIATALAELTSSMIDPIHAAALWPERYSIDALRRTQWSNQRAIAVDMSSQIRPEAQATVYLDEATMRAHAAETSLSSDQRRIYHFTHGPLSESRRFPSEIDIERRGGETWTVYLSDTRLSTSDRS